jgi:predicted transcriptional regulator
MARTPNDITEAELSVLQILWQEGEATIRRITDALYPDGTQAHYATVQKLLERLEGKDCVARGRSGAVNVFRPLLDRDELVGRRLQAVAEQLCGGSWTPLLTHLVQTQKLTDAERRELRRLVDELAPPAPGVAKRKEKS